MLVIQLIPAEVLAERRRQQEEIVGRAKKAGKIAAVVIVVIWIMATSPLLWLIFRAVNRP
jgi:hypothetical protein